MRSMRCACGGRMSSMFSGRSQLRTAIHALPRKIEDQQADQHRGEPEEADLAVSKFGDAAKGFAPQGREQKRQDALDHQHQGKSHEESGAHSLAALPEVLEVPEELRARIEHQHVALVLEGGAVGFEAAVKGVEL